MLFFECKANERDGDGCNVNETVRCVVRSVAWVEIALSMVSGVAKDSQKKKTTWIRRTGLTEVGHGFISEAATLSHQRLV